jgi:hypothetical protein
MWCNQRFRGDFQRRFRVGEKSYNLPPQPIRLCWIKAAGDRRSAGNHDCGPACILPGLQLVTMSNSEQGKSDVA